MYLLNWTICDGLFYLNDLPEVVNVGLELADPQVVLLLGRLQLLAQLVLLLLQRLQYHHIGDFFLNDWWLFIYIAGFQHFVLSLFQYSIYMQFFYIIVILSPVSYTAGIFPAPEHKSIKNIMEGWRIFNILFNLSYEGGGGLMCPPKCFYFTKNLSPWPNPETHL